MQDVAKLYQLYQVTRKKGIYYNCRTIDNCKFFAQIQIISACFYCNTWSIYIFIYISRL